MKIRVLLRLDVNVNRYGWYPAGAWLDADESWKAFDAAPSPAILAACELHGADDLATLAAKLDEANVKLFAAQQEIEQLRKFKVEAHIANAENTVKVSRVAAAPGVVVWQPRRVYESSGGHCFLLRGNQTEPDEVTHCTRCGVSYAGTGPTMSDPCPGGKP